MKNINDTLTEIKRAYIEINKWMFGGKLVEPILIVQSYRSIGKQAGGWFTCGKVWQNKETGVEHHEIAVAAECIANSVYSVLETLVHEMVHYWCKENGIDDCNNNYHNKRFKQAAEKFGLIVTNKPSPRYGYQSTKAGDELKRFFDALDIDESVFNIGLKTSQISPQKTYTMYVYECDGCDCFFKTGRQLSHVVCGECGGTYHKKGLDEITKPVPNYGTGKLKNNRM